MRQNTKDKSSPNAKSSSLYFKIKTIHTYRMKSWIIYILECADGTYYTGITNNFEKRIADHNNGAGAKYTRSRTPVTLKYSEKCEDRSAASKREYALKQLSRAQKKALISKHQD